MLAPEDLEETVAMKRADVLRIIDGHLLPIGFVRSKYTWHRKYLHLVDVLDAQWSSFENSFTLNLGVCDTDIHQRCWNRVFIPVFAAGCTIERRIGSLSGNRDRWWNMEIAEDAFEVDFAELSSTHVLPFFDRNHSTQGMIDALSENEKVIVRSPNADLASLALLLHRTGQVDKARTLLEQGERFSIGAWGDTIKRLLALMRS